MKPDDILVNHCYRMKSGALCRVNALTKEGVVCFTPEGEVPEEPQEMDLEAFAASIEEKAPLPPR